MTRPNVITRPKLQECFVVCCKINMRGASPSDTCASAQLVYIVCTFICIPYWDASIMEQIAIIGHCNEYYFEDEWLPVA